MATQTRTSIVDKNTQQLPPSKKWTLNAKVMCMGCGKVFRGHIRESIAKYLGDEWDKWYCMDCLEVMLNEEDEE